MNIKIAHWTERSIKDFLYRIGADFVTQLEDVMESRGLKQVDLARRLELSEGRVSQLMNNPGNLTLSMIIKCARALDMKVAIVAYDDNDNENIHGPINSDIFRICWERAGQPLDFWSLNNVQVFEVDESAITTHIVNTSISEGENVILSDFIGERGYTAVNEPFSDATSVSTTTFSPYPRRDQNEPKPLAA